MTVIDTIRFEDATDLLNRTFDSGKMNPLNNAMKESWIVTVNTIPLWTWKTRRHKEIPVGEQYADYKVEGWASTKTKVQQGYYKDTTSRTFAKAIDITWEMRKLDKTEIYRASKFIMDSVISREDLNLSMFISFGTATSYTDKNGQTVDISTGDALAPFYSAHTLTGSSTTYRTRIANNPAFSEWALELAEDLLRTNTYSNLWELVWCSADTIITTDYPTLINSVRRVIQSSAQISAPNEWVVNVYQGRYTHKILPRIDMTANAAKDSDKKNYWLLADSKITSFFHDVYVPTELHTPNMGNNGEDIETLNWTWNIIGAHDSCMVSARWIAFSSWDGTA